MFAILSMAHVRALYPAPWHMHCDLANRHHPHRRRTLGASEGTPSLQPTRIPAGVFLAPASRSLLCAAGLRLTDFVHLLFCLSLHVVVGLSVVCVAWKFVLSSFNP